MDKTKNEEKSKDRKSTLITVAVFCSVVFLAFFGMYQLKKIQDEERRVEGINYWKYISDHQCVRTGFAGKYATPTYQCDNGLWLSDEIDSFANPKESK